MILYKFALTAVALAVCQIAAAQVPTISPDASSTVPAGNVIAVKPQSPAALPVGTQDPTRNDKTAVIPAAATPSEPRIIRGNDQMIAPSKAVPRLEGSPISFNFEEAPVAQVVRTILGDVLKADYVLYPPLAGTVTMATRMPVAPDNAAFLLESALQANGLAMVRDARGTYHVGRPDALKGVGGSVRQVGSGPLSPGSGAIIVPLQFIGATEMAAILRPMMQAESLVRVDALRNLLVLTGTRTQAEGWLDLVSTFDVSLLKGMSVGVFPLKYASIKEVEAALTLVGGGGATAAAAPSGGRGTTASTVPAGSGAGAPASLGEGNPLFGALRIMPIERLNSILVVTPRAAYLEEARRWIEKLDQPSDNGAEPQLFIYQVQNVNARHLAGVLSGIFGGQTGAVGAASSGVSPGLNSATGSSFGQTGGASSNFGNSNSYGSGNALGGLSGAVGGLGTRTGGGQLGAANAFGGRSTAQGAATQAPVAASLGGVRVMADELNNSVLVWSTKAEYAKIEATLKRLDLPLTQVLIEATIVEVTLNNDLRYGLQWAFNDSRSGTDFRGLGTLSSRDGDASGGIIGGALAGFSYALKTPSGNVRAMLNALSAKTTVKVVASPSLMVLDNHTASIAVGDQTPIQAGTTRNLEGTVTSTEIQYKDTGVNLVVTPSVNAGNIVTMQVDQSVTDVGAQDEVSKQRAFLQRQLSSKVAVRSGESIVMGGLIQENSTATKSGIPLLHNLPLVGSLFGSTSNDGRRTELLVVITPRVVRSDIDIRQVSDDLRDQMKGLKDLDLRERGGAISPTPAPSQPALSN